MAERLIVIGDIHGRLDLFLKTLRISGILNKDNRWTAKGVTVIQMGDLIDRGPHSLKLIKFVHNLKKQAELNGSTLETLYGNHEIMALFSGIGNNHAKMQWYYNGGDSVYKEWLKVTGREDYPDQWPCLPEFYEDFAPTGFYGKIILRSKCFIVKNKILFSHGGINFNDDLNNFERLFKTIFHKKDSSKYDEGIFGRQGPFWLREYQEDIITDVCDKLGVKFQVVGHTPKNGFSVECNGKMVFSDVGINQNNLPCAIEFLDNQVKIITDKKTYIIDEPIDDIFVPLVKKPKPYPYTNPKFKENDYIRLFATHDKSMEVHFKIESIIKDFGLTWYLGKFIYNEEGTTRVREGRWPIGHIDRNGRKVLENTVKQK